MICYVLVLAFLSGKVLALENEIKMIADVIAFYNKPPGILVRACWRAPIKKKLINELNNMAPPKPMQFIRDVDDIPSAFTRHDLMIICDINCSDNKQFLAKVNSTNKFRSPYRWLLITRSTENNKEILNDLKYFHILIDSEVLVSEKNGDTFSLYLPYKLQSNCSDWKLESFGTWSLKHRLNNTKEMYTGLSMRRKNMDLFPITASLAITNNSTKKSLFSLKDLHIDLVTKAGYRQLLPLYQFMNATPVLLFANNWGHLVNGSYIGMLGHIARGDAELAGMVLFMTLERLDIVQFLSVPSIPTIKFVFRQPSLSYQNNLFILPFKPKVWYCIFGLIIFIFIIALINAKWESIKMAQEDNNLDRMVLRPDTSEIAMMIIGAVTQQGSYTEFKGTLGRVLMFIMFFVFLFLYTSYSANIVALLQSTSNQIRTLADLLNSKLELGVEDTPYNRYFFSAATEPVKKAIYEKKIAPRGSKANFISLQEGVLKLQKKPYAFNMFLGSGYRLVEKYFLEHEKCGLQEIAYIDENKPWQACGKKSPFKEIFKIGLFRNVEHGLNSRETRLLFAKKPSCSAHGGNFDSVYMRDFYPALLMLAYGVTLSIILLIFEICHWRRFNKRKIIL